MAMTGTRRIEAQSLPLDCLPQDDSMSDPGQCQLACPQTQQQLLQASGPAAPALIVKPVGDGGRPPGHESHARTIVKSLTWRFGGLVMTVGVAWCVTGSPEVAASIGLADTLVKVVVFYLHERLWLKIRFGRARAPEYEI